MTNDNLFPLPHLDQPRLVKARDAVSKAQEAYNAAELASDELGTSIPKSVIADLFNARAELESAEREELQKRFINK